jgi:hypothetical protein
MKHIPDKYWYVDVYGAEYYIPWGDFFPGYSIFIKTTATARDVQRAFQPAADYLRITLKAHPRFEFGYYGVRVWRLA